jgi:hypothetical protein
VLPEVRQNRQTRDEKLFAKSWPAKAFGTLRRPAIGGSRSASVFPGVAGFAQKLQNPTARGSSSRTALRLQNIVLLITASE